MVCDLWELVLNEVAGYLHTAVPHIILREELHAHNSKEVVSDDDDDDCWSDAGQEEDQRLEDITIPLSYPEQPKQPVD